ncbi:MAG TPA: response regulator [Candidatus Limnocylindrales bacterium]|nr:response regulator [Candidatus Limnocylindrales bacterium]
MAEERVVLLVEDEEPNRALLRAVLARASGDRLRGVVLVEAEDLASARQVLATRHVDLVLLDVRLPDGNGLTLIPAGADQMVDSPRFVVLSASVLPAERQTALASGAAGFLAKPYRSAELIDTVAEVLDIES